MLRGIDFEQTLLHGMLSFLLFAGALHVNLADLAQQRWVIATLATSGCWGRPLIIGVLSWWLFGLLGLDMPLLYCLVFGALISPTDPIAVLGILKSAGARKTLETKITGESLFNDGVAVVVFLVLAGIAFGGHGSGRRRRCSGCSPRRRWAAPCSALPSAPWRSGCCAASTTTRSRS